MALNFKIDVSVSEKGKGSQQYLVDDITGEQNLKYSFEDFRELLIDTAEETLKEEQRMGFEKNPRVRTDNVFEKNPKTVKTFGKIEYFAKQDVAEALYDIFVELNARSPVDTGKYKKSNVMFYNNVPVAHSPGELKTWVTSIQNNGGFQPSDVIRFINTSPYARKLEYKGIARAVKGPSVGMNIKKGKRTRKKSGGGSIMVPSGAYYLTHRLIRARYKSIANLIKFTFLPNGANGINIQPLPGERTTFKKDNRPYLYPTIVIKLSGEGIKGEYLIE